jgi:aminomethyltransferase
MSWLLVVNASNRKKIVEHMKAVAGDDAVKIEDTTLTTAMIALQGPAVMPRLIEQMPELGELKRYRFTSFDLMGNSILISRTGYTGEDGIEAIFPTNLLDAAFEMLAGDDELVSTFPPAGLGARDTLRIEAGMPLYGHELSEEIDPLTAGLKFAVSLDKGEDDRVPKFVGQDALAAIGASPAQRLVGLRIEGKRTPRQGAAVLVNGKSVGGVTSGCLSPTLGEPIAMALLGSDLTDGQPVEVDLGRKTVTAAICPLPFYKPGK